MMQDVLNMIENIARNDLSVVITGEHGTGKEWAARRIHVLSARSRRPFEPRDCTELPEEALERELFGYESLVAEGITIQRSAFEEAEGGTLLLNDIASISPSLQLRLARAVEYEYFTRAGDERRIPVDVRLIATVSERAETLVQRGALTKELFYRISPIVLELPPLRKHREDIPVLVENIIEELRRRNAVRVSGISPDALKMLASYHWPGNVRQLKNAVEYASAMSREAIITPPDLPAYVLNKLP
jgi:DNA-binding NtrC family response regulator